MKRVFLLIIVFSIVSVSCQRKVRCIDQFITPAFIGFSFADLDTIVVREYKRADNFHTLLDSTVIVTDSGKLARGSLQDTTFVVLNDLSGKDSVLFPEYDWQIVVPARDVTILLSDFDSPENTKKCTLGGDLCPVCVNPIISFLQNGLQVIPHYSKIPYFGGDHYVTYISR